jgi:hypothetical protein
MELAERTMITVVIEATVGWKTDINGRQDKVNNEAEVG